MPTVPTMMWPRRVSLILGLLLPMAVQAQPAPKRLSALPLSKAQISVDGRFDEAIWARAPVGTNFVERDPFPGRRPAETGSKTEVRVLYDRDALYIGVTAYMPPSMPTRAFELTRDSFNVFSDDAISVKIDVRLDQRTTIGFVTTPAGTQVDYVAVENGDGFRREFDAIWTVGTQTYEDRWTAEFRLPFVALGLPGHQGDRILGFQITRDHNATQATYDWAPIPPQFGAVSALHYGRLEGLKEVAGGTPLTVVPYLLAGYDGTSNDPELKVGGDLRLRIGEDTWSEVTILTDFAQVDLDDPVINLDRFPLFLPERRPFFLSGLEVFQTGSSGLSQIFFSRRIGLAGSDEVPLLGGLKVYGSQGRLRFGLLQALTDDTSATAADNYTVASARYNFGEVGSFGLMGTLNGNIKGLTDEDFEGNRYFQPNYSIAADGSLRLLDRKVQLTGFMAASFNSEMQARDQGYSGQFKAKYLGLNFSPSATISLISEEFDPLVGFVARRNLLQSRVDLYSIYRTSALGLRNISVSASGQVEVQASDQDYLGRSASLKFTSQWESGFKAYAQLQPIEDRVVRPFFLSAADRSIEVGTYRGVRMETGISSPDRRNPVGSLDYTYSSAFFGGQLHQLRASARWSLGSLMRLEMGSNLNLLDFPDRKVRSAVTLNGKIVLTPDTKISIDLIGQANTTNKKAVALLRLRWRYLPGSDLFFVYREFLDFEPGTKDVRTLALKLSYRFDLVY